MLQTKPVKARVLCFSEAQEALPPDLAMCLDATITTDLATATGEVVLSCYDCYLAFGGGGLAGAGDFWLQARAADPNTPFVLVSRDPLPASIEPRMRPGYDIFAPAPCSGYEVMMLVNCLVNSAELRSLRARMDEARAIAEDLKERLHQVDERAAAAGAAAARAEMHMMRAKALDVFSAAGGSRSFFERYWEDMLATALRRHRQPGA